MSKICDVGLAYNLLIPGMKRVELAKLEISKGTTIIMGDRCLRKVREGRICILTVIQWLALAGRIVKRT